MLKVPYHSQEDPDARAYDNDGGSACVSMILEWAGKWNPPLTINMLSAETSLEHSDTTLSVSSVANLMTKHGIPAECRPSVTLEVLRQEIEVNQRPLIALISYKYIVDRLNQKDKAGHFVVVVGIDDKYVYINDPDWYGAHRDKGASLPVALNLFDQGLAEGDPSRYGIFIKDSIVSAQPAATIQPTSTETPPAMSSAIVGPAYVNTVSGVNVRDTPGGAIIAKVPEKTNITVLPDVPVNAALDSQTCTWVKVQTATGMTGWCVQDYLTAGCVPTV